MYVINGSQKYIGAISDYQLYSFFSFVLSIMVCKITDSCHDSVVYMLIGYMYVINCIQKSMGVITGLHSI